VFLNKIAGDGLTFVPREIGETADPGFARIEQAIGTGPFIMTAGEEKVSAEFVRNPDYWKPGQPYLDGIRIVGLNQGHGDERAWAAFQGNQVDITVIPGAEVKGYISRQGAGFQPDWAKDITPYSVVPNVKVKPFDDARVTKALRLLVDHDEAITAWGELFAGRGRHGSFLPANMDDWDLSHEEYARLPEWKSNKDDAVREALSLLGAAGFNKDNPLRFQLSVSTTPSFQAMGVLLQGQYRRLGQGVVDTQIRQLDGTAYQTARANRDYAFMMSSNATSYFDPDAWFFQVYYSGAARNYWNHSDTRLDGMFDRQRTLFDRAQRKTAIRDIMNYMLENWPGTGITSAYALNALRPNVRGFQPEIWFNGRQYENVWLNT
jgi:ABC-type transport system substrate-binding protein